MILFGFCSLRLKLVVARKIVVWQWYSKHNMYSVYDPYNCTGIPRGGVNARLVSIPRLQWILWNMFLIP
jgi:hypothetical protein